ncbi:MAG: 4-vinyl reductase [Thermoplasmata archaeon]
MTRDANEFSSFAETIASLGSLTKLESAISTAIKSSRVPAKETRKFLKCMNTQEAGNTALFQFMQNLFEKVGVGQLELIRNDIFRYDFAVENSPICKLYPHVKGKKTCYITAESLSQFFTKDLSLPGTAEETACRNAGDKRCEFAVSLQPLAVYQLALDAVDKSIINGIMNGENRKSISESLEMADDEIIFRMNILKRYKILDDVYQMTEIGETYHKYGEGMGGDEEDFEPPWKDMARISNAISASTSFAEAFTETASKEPLWDVKEKDIVNLADEAKKSKSFAELLSKQVKSDKEE